MIDPAQPLPVSGVNFCLYNVNGAEAVPAQLIRDLNKVRCTAKMQITVRELSQCNCASHNLTTSVLHLFTYIQNLTY